eukprot:g7639.t1
MFHIHFKQLHPVKPPNRLAHPATALDQPDPWPVLPRPHQYRPILCQLNTVFGANLRISILAPFRPAFSPATSRTLPNHRCFDIYDAVETRVYKGTQPDRHASRHASRHATISFLYLVSFSLKYFTDFFKVIVMTKYMFYSAYAVSTKH